MKLEKLKIKNFTRYEKCEIEFDTEINIIMGANVSGKTSILDAIAYQLTGRCERTDRGGKDSKDMIRVGTKEAEIESTIKVGNKESLSLTRSIPGGLSIYKQSGNVTSLQESINEYLEVNNKVVTAALNPTEFIDMKPDEQKNMLFDLMGLEFDRKSIIISVSNEVPEEIKLEIYKLLDTAPNGLYDETGKTFANLYKFFYEQRRLAKSILKKMGIRQETIDVPDLIYKLGIENRIQEVSKTISDKTLILEAQDQRQALKEQLELDNSAVQEDLKNSGDPKTAQVELEKSKKELNDYNQIIHEKKVEALRLKEIAQTINSTTDCPLAPDLIECPLGEERKMIVTKLQIQQKELEEEIEKLMPLLLPVQQKREKLEMEAKKKDKKDVTANLEKIEKELTKTIEGIFETEKLKEEIEILSNRRDEDQNILANINHNEGRKEEIDNQNAERKELEDQIEVLEVLVKTLSPKGLPGKILSKVIEPVQEKVNKKLQDFTGGLYSLRLEVEPDFRILVSHNNIEGNLKMLSSSERMRVGVVLQDALVSLSGLRFLIVDNVDILDIENQKLFIETLTKIKGEYDTIIVLLTGERSEALNLSTNDGNHVWWLEQGEIKEIRDD